MKTGMLLLNTRCIRGFTIVELLVVLAMGGILVGAAVPSLLAYVQSKNLDGAARVIWGDLQSARMEAIKTNQSVTVQFASTTLYSFSFVDGVGVTHTFWRNLGQDYPGVTVALDAGNTLTFRSTGSGQPGVTRTVTVTGPSGALSFQVSWTGRIQNL